MSILNRESDGIYSVLLTIVSALCREKAISRDDLIDTWGKLSTRDDGATRDKLSRFRGVLNRWIALGLFVEEGNSIRLSVGPKRGQSEESFLTTLPDICRRLVLNVKHAYPLWPENDRITEEDLGITADFCRGLAWCLCQDIYSLPTSWNGGINDLFVRQVIPERSIIQNDTRWQGLQDWAQFLGFAVNGSTGIFFDPTLAVRSAVQEILEVNKQIPADHFLTQLSERLPVLDGGVYRVEIEKVLRPDRWSPPPPGHLSTALSFALRRLQKQAVLSFSTLSDASTRLTLTRLGGHRWESFTHVSLLRKVT